MTVLVYFVYFSTSLMNKDIRSLLMLRLIRLRVTSHAPVNHILGAAINYTERLCDIKWLFDFACSNISKVYRQ